MSEAAATPRGASGLAPALERARELWHWWTAELAGMLPAPLRRRLAAAPPVLLASLLDGGGFAFARLQAGEAHPLHAAAVPGAADALPVWLRLPAACVLTRELDWPAMPMADLRRAARLDLDRQTPCAAEALWFDVVPLARDHARRRVSVLLVVAHRAAVEAALAALARAHGIHGAARVTFDAAPEIADRVALAPAAAAPEEAAPAGLSAMLRPLLPRGLRARLLLACALLGALNLALHAGAEEARRARLDEAVAEARQRAQRVERLRAQMNERRQVREELMSRRGDIRLLAVLDQLTRLIPDDAWLDSVEVRGASVYVTGTARVASSLVALIEISPMFADAQFRSPVTPDRAAGGTEGAGRERFDMAIRLRERP